MNAIEPSGLCESQATHLNESWRRERGEVTFLNGNRAERSVRVIRRRSIPSAFCRCPCKRFRRGQGVC